MNSTVKMDIVCEKDLSVECKGERWHKSFFMILIFSFLLMVSSSGCATLSGRTVGESIDDATIVSKINVLIVKDESLKFFKIDVDSFKGNVTLSGGVKTKKDEEKIIKLARGVLGVRSVKSNLIIEK